MHYLKVGNGAPIIFLHGWGCDGNIFLPIANRLGEYSCYLVDFEGFGKSPMPAQQGWCVYDYVQSLLQFVLKNNLKNFTIVAHSFGCRVALMFCALYPKYVQKILLVAPAGLKKFSLFRAFKVAKYKCAKFLCKIGVIKNLPNAGSADYKNCSPALKNTFVKVVCEDLSKYAKMVDCPTLIVNGKEDDATPLSHAKKLQKLMPNCQLTAIEGGHFALFYNTTAFAQTIKIFMESAIV